MKKLKFWKRKGVKFFKAWMQAASEAATVSVSVPPKPSPLRADISVSVCRWVMPFLPAILRKPMYLLGVFKSKYSCIAIAISFFCEAANSRRNAVASICKLSSIPSYRRTHLRRRADMSLSVVSVIAFSLVTMGIRLWTVSRLLSESRTMLRHCIDSRRQRVEWRWVVIRDSNVSSG